MRPQDKQAVDLSPSRLFTDVALLVCESRLPNSELGKAEGVHCPKWIRPGKTTPEEHRCSSSALLCSQASEIETTAAECGKNRLPLSVKVLLHPNTYRKDCSCHATLLESWTLQLTAKRSCDEKLLPPQFSLQAVWSHLHFSQLSAWLVKTRGKLPFNVSFQTSLAGEDEPRGEAGVEGPTFETHTFPPCVVGKWVLSVRLESLPRQDEPPNLSCFCTSSPPPTPPQENPFPTLPELSEDTDSFRLPSSLARPSRREEKAVETGVSELVAAVSSRLDLTPIPLPSRPVRQAPPPPSFSVENPLFMSSWSENAERRLSRRLEQVRGGGSGQGGTETPRAAVTFFIDPSTAPPVKPPVPHTLDLATGASTSHLLQPSSTPSSQHKKRKASQTILFSSERDVYLSDTLHSPDPLEGVGCCTSPQLPLWVPPTPRPNNPAPRNSPTHPQGSTTTGRKTSSTEGISHENSDLHANISQARNKVFLTSSRKSFNSSIPSHIAKLHSGFNSITGLPVSSSPAPLKRNQYSFDYDSSLHNVTGIRSALYYDHDSGSSDSESGTSMCKSAPASTNLLGNFEESALNGRIKPFGQLEGFSLDIAASGAFCPPHVSLPVTTFFFNISDDNAPSPYLGHCSLDSLGKKGYYVPRKGTVQATLFNPQGTVVKMFVVRYDMSDMPVCCQTFVRQRTFFMPSFASIQDARRNRSWLRYLIHLRFVTSRSGKLYLHTDVRMLFSRKSELDSYNGDLEKAETAPSPLMDMGTYELRSFTEMPQNPKFSPRKLGSKSECVKTAKKD